MYVFVQVDWLEHMACRGICQRYKHERHGVEAVYDKGGSRCNAFCHVFISWLGLYCPCCGMRLRKTSRSKYGNIRKMIDVKRN